MKINLSLLPQSSTALVAILFATFGIAASKFEILTPIARGFDKLRAGRRR